MDKIEISGFNNIDSSIITSACTTTTLSGSLEENCSYKLDNSYIINIIDSSQILILGIICYIQFRFLYRLFFK